MGLRPWGFKGLGKSFIKRYNTAMMGLTRGYGVVPNSRVHHVVRRQ